ncbi:MAG: acyltransferase [Crocinitomicaceae bacterium]|nr:acyltransferase [Flavobacteriales bacterium]NQZ37295.1 acyltransferase [Crocinitomicaceae bacterium]
MRHVDEFSVFPAIQFQGRFKVHIEKKKDAKLIIEDRLILERWTHRKNATVITLNESSTMKITSRYILGDGIKILLSEKAKLILNGRKNESGAGITANSTILVNESLEIGHDCIIAWDTFITDSDWHTISGKEHTSPTTIAEKVWIGVGVKILKGVQLGKNSIVTSNSVVTSGIYPEQSMISGSPAKVMKEGIPNWTREMLDKVN